MVFVKFVFLSFFFRFWFVVLPLSKIFYKYLVVSAIGSFFYGTIGAVRQNVIKRVLAYTSMGQTAFFLLGLLTCSVQGFFASVFHMLVYLLTLLLFFTIFFINKNYNNSEILFNTDLTGLGKKAPLLAFGYTIVFLSLAGVPPLLGFFSKFLILISLVNSKHYFLALFSLLASVIISFIYFRFIKII